LSAGSFSLRTFYLNRIRRLAPALSTTLFVVILAGAFWFLPTELVELAKQVLAAQFYVANIYYWRSINYFGLTAHDVYLLHTWSLGVEEQFYLFFPIFCMLLYRYLKKYFWFVLLFGLVISFCTNILLVARKPELTFYLLPARAWQLLMGAMALGIADRWTRTHLQDQVLGLIGVAVVAVSVTCYRKDITVPGYFALLPTIGAACLLVSGRDQRTYVARFLSLEPLVYLGAISYPLYLVHWPINNFSILFADTNSLTRRILCFGLSIILAAAIYHLVEQPIRRRRFLSTTRPLVIGYGAGLTVAASLFIAVYATHGLPQRFPANVVGLASYIDDKNMPLTECEYLDLPITESKHLCRIGAADSKPNWFVFGDSHAWAAHDAFAKWLSSRGEAGYFAHRPGCPPLFDVHIFGDRDSCFNFNREAASFIESNPELTNIVMISIWLEVPEGGLSRSSGVYAGPKESLEIFKQSFAKTLERLHNLGRRIFVWEPVPGAKKSVPLEMARAALAGRSPDLERPVDEYRTQYRFFFDALKEDGKWIYERFSPEQALCESGRCAVTSDGRPLYIDGNHLTKSTADFWAQVLQNGRPVNDQLNSDTP